MKILIIFCFSLILLCSCLFVAHFGRRWDLKPLIALGSGALLSICFLDFLPQAFRGQTSYEVIPIFILFGILVQGLADIYLLPYLGFLDKYLKKESSNPVHSHSHTFNTGSVCSLAGCLSICSFFDGIRLFSALSITESVAFVTAFALFFHLLSEGVLVASLALSSGIKKKALFVLVFCLAGSLILGALFAQMFFISFSYSSLIAFASGILIYVCFVHLLPFSLKQKKKSWFFIGLLLFLGFHFLV